MRRSLPVTTNAAAAPAPPSPTVVVAMVVLLLLLVRSIACSWMLWSSESFPTDKRRLLVVWCWPWTLRSSPGRGEYSWMLRSRASNPTDATRLFSLTAVAVAVDGPVVNVVFDGDCSDCMLLPPRLMRRGPPSTSAGSGNAGIGHMHAFPPDSISVVHGWFSTCVTVARSPGFIASIHRSRSAASGSTPEGNLYTPALIFDLVTAASGT